MRRSSARKNASSHPWCLLALLLIWSGSVLATANQHSTEKATDAEDPGLSTVPGGVLVWPVPEDATALRYDGKPVFVAHGHAFVGVSMSTKPGPARLSYQLGDRTVEQAFVVQPKAYTEQHITIENEDLVTPPARNLERIREESRRQRALYNSFTHIGGSDHLAQGMRLPLEGIVTSLFGHRRFFNGKPRNPHSGLDIAADAGTPIIAAADGTVVLSDDLYFNGNTLFLDHGQGLITMYCHMQEMLVEVGAEITAGTTIGLVGATGRATGPHLHWTVSLNGTRVDPEMFMQALNGVTTSGARQPAAALPGTR